MWEDRDPLAHAGSRRTPLYRVCVLSVSRRTHFSNSWLKTELHLPESWTPEVQDQGGSRQPLPPGALAASGGGRRPFTRGHRAPASASTFPWLLPVSPLL